MGCSNSKLDDLPAVALCRERCNFLDEAIRQRYVLADTHIAYVHSLRQVGDSLHNFLTNNGNNNRDHGGGGGSPLSPKLNLPPAAKKEVAAETTSAVAKGGGGGTGHHSRSNSEGHIQFHSDPDGDDSVSGSGSFSGHSSPLHDHGHDHDHDHHHDDSFGHIDYGNPELNYHTMMSADQETLGLGGYNTTHMNMNYMKSQAIPSIVYEQKPISPETVQNYHVGESSSSSYYPYSYPYPNPGSNLSAASSSSQPYFGYQPGYGGGGHYGFQTTYGSTASPPPAGPVASSSKPPPPPPSPPRASAWDFLNPFESYEKFYPSYTPSRDSKELREEEGIPDLEDEDFQHEVVKKVHGDEKFMDSGGGSGGSVAGDEGGHVGGGGDAEASLYTTRPSVEDVGVEYEVHVVEKKVLDEEKKEERSNAVRPGSRDASDVAREIKDQFMRASESGSEIAKMLGPRRFPYQQKHASKMLHIGIPSLSVVSPQLSTSKSAEASSSINKAGPAYLDIDEDMAMRTRSLSATLQKLYLWEKKLCNEVKAEEKMRVVHDSKVRKLKRLDERGAEAHKVDATRTAVRNLSVKLGMAIQVVDRISVTINKIRDEELWPQLNELIQGLTRMWKSMLECHHSQCQAIREAKNLGPIGSGNKFDDAHLEATSKFEHELLNWIFQFSTWIGAQKGYVKALNSWLLKCLLYEPEETPDGIVPFSPGRIGAPPIFVICNQWFQALDRLLEKEVIDSMRVLAMSVFQLWEHDKLEMRQKMVVNRDLDTKVRNLDREDQKIQKELQALDKKIVLASGDAVYQSDTTSSSLQGSLQRIFHAMERFTAESVKVYEELFQRAEEERLAQENERNS